MIGYPIRFDPAFQHLKQQIRNGILGDIEIAHATYISSGPFFHRAEGLTPRQVPEWWFNRELTGGGALIDLGSHVINLLRWYFGEVIGIKSYLGYRFNMPFEDSAICLVKFKNGTKAVISVGWFSHQYHLEVKLFGTVKHAQMQHKPKNKLLTVIQILATNTSRFYQAHLAELQHFVNCLVHNKMPTPTEEDGLRDLEVIEQAYKNQVGL